MIKKWIKEHLRLIIISSSILILLILTGASYAWKGEVSPPGRIIQSITNFVTEPVSKGTNAAASVIKGVFQFKDVVKENEKLKKENEKLKNELVKNSLKKSDLDELRKLSATLAYKDVELPEKKITGQVVSMDTSLWFRIFTINLGEKDGVHKDDVVINSDGLVGRVMDCGGGWAKVVSILDNNTDISFRVYRDPNMIGILRGNGKDGLEGYMLDENAKVVEGDLVISSGLMLYPKGIPIGKIKKIVQDNDSLLQKVEVEPSVNFKNLRIVSVVEGKGK